MKRKKCPECGSKLIFNGAVNASTETKNIYRRGTTGHPEHKKIQVFNGVKRSGCRVELRFKCTNPSCPVQHIISDGKSLGDAIRSLNKAISKECSK